MGNSTRWFVVGALVAGLVAACSGGEDEEERVLPVSNGIGPAPYDPGVTYEPTVTGADLAPLVDNDLLPFPVGATWSYEAETDEGLVEVRMEVLAEPVEVWGVTATVVHDSELINGELVEDTWDWFAQDAAGNVWYLGEDTAEYENGVVVSTAGAWTAGEAGALPGVVMLGEPAVGLVYREEFLEGEAEDVGQVQDIDVTVTVAAGTFSGCIKTYEVSVIDPELVEYKYFCPDVGMVLTEEEDERLELVEYTMP